MSSDKYLADDALKASMALSITPSSVDMFASTFSFFAGDHVAFIVFYCATTMRFAVGDSVPTLLRVSTPLSSSCIAAM